MGIKSGNNNICNSLSILRGQSFVTSSCCGVYIYILIVQTHFMHGCDSIFIHIVDCNRMTSQCALSRDFVINMYAYILY
jgi:hypothetical protein